VAQVGDAQHLIVRTAYEPGGIEIEFGGTRVKIAVSELSRAIQACSAC
jgi:hypothetical protein